MAWLVLVDDTRMEVGYNQAAKIYAILKGDKEIEPTNKDEYIVNGVYMQSMFEASDEYKNKEAFLLKVKKVEFEDGKTANGPRPWEKWMNK